MTQKSFFCTLNWWNHIHTYKAWDGERGKIEEEKKPEIEQVNLWFDVEISRWNQVNSICVSEIGLKKR